ncbi:MAG: STAS domain-containing protein [Proteobacteria bacterium]|nr:STAS domain-containing protein [Pseudomonadota bacterium]
MAARNFEVAQDVDGTYLLKGDLTIHDLDYLKGFLENARSRSRKLNLSLAEVGFADTASLQLIIAFRKNLGSGGKLVITALSPEVEKILEVSGLKSQMTS